MFPIERRRWLVEHARESGRIDVSAAASTLGVAVETIRRDLAELERRSLVKRVHGGAVPVEGAAFVTSFDVRRGRGLLDEKRRIAEVVAGLLEDVDSLFLDEGSTTQGVAELLDGGRARDVVTASLPIATVLVERPNVDVIMLGGRVRPVSRAAADAWTGSMLQGIVVDAAVLGANGVTLTHGATCPDATLADVKARAMSIAHQRILACDSSKFGVDSFIRFASLDQFTHVVTDTGLPGDLVRGIQDFGVEVVLA